MNEQIQEYFSCADWLLIPAYVRKEVADILGLTLLSENEQWGNNPILCTTYKMQTIILMTFYREWIRY